MSKTEELTKLVEQISKQKNDEEEMQKRRELLGNFLIEAIKKDDILMQKLAFLLGADVTVKNNEAIVRASAQGHTEIVKALIKAGSDVTESGNYAIQITSENGHAEVVKILIDNGADVTDCHNEAIRNASENGYEEVVELLIKAGASFS